MLYPSEGWLPEGLLERVADAISEKASPALLTAAKEPNPPPLEEKDASGTRHTQELSKTNGNETEEQSQKIAAPAGTRPARPSLGSRAATAAYEASLPQQLRRPMLPCGESGSVGRLLWFCAQAARRSYEGVYASSARFPTVSATLGPASQAAPGPTGRGSGGVDEAAVDKGLLGDMLDG